jgi:hypothetical protein
MSKVCGDKLPSGNILEDYEDYGPPKKKTQVTFHKKKCGGKKR